MAYDAERQKRYRQNHKEKILTRDRAHHRRNRKRYAGYHAKYIRSPQGRFLLAVYTAKRRGKTWEIPESEYSSLVMLPCDYCKGQISAAGVGLDRIDNRLGYFLTNVVPCCKSCNFRKGHLECAGFIYPRTVELMRELEKKNGINTCNTATN